MHGRTGCAALSRRQGPRLIQPIGRMRTRKTRQPTQPETEATDREWLATAFSDVKPLLRKPRALLPKDKPLPVARQRLNDEKAVLRDSLSDSEAWDLGLESGEELFFARDGLGTQHVRKLRRGYWSIRDQIDLHGMTSDEARSAVAHFLNCCVDDGLRCIRIIHGKGLGSPGGEPVLKKKLSRWLIQREDVLAYCQAPPAEGGSGAVLVLLRGNAVPRSARFK
jgi:DNA-nicking Smr family endonuclease